MLWEPDAGGGEGVGTFRTNKTHRDSLQNTISKSVLTTEYNQVSPFKSLDHTILCYTTLYCSILYYAVLTFFEGSEPALHNVQHCILKSALYNSMDSHVLTSIRTFCPCSSTMYTARYTLVYYTIL